MWLLFSCDDLYRIYTGRKTMNKYIWRVLKMELDCNEQIILISVCKSDIFLLVIIKAYRNICWYILFIKIYLFYIFLHIIISFTFRNSISVYIIRIIFLRIQLVTRILMRVVIVFKINEDFISYLNFVNIIYNNWFYILYFFENWVFLKCNINKFVTDCTRVRPFWFEWPSSRNMLIKFVRFTLGTPSILSDTWMVEKIKRKLRIKNQNK